VLSYAHFQAFKFPDSMEVHFQCTIQICRYQCPDQCSEAGHVGGDNPVYGPPSIDAFLHAGRPRDERRVRRAIDPEKEVGVNRIIRVVSTGDLTFAIDDNSTSTTMVFPAKEEINGSSGLICMTTPSFAATLVILLAILVISCLMSAFLFVRIRPFRNGKSIKENKKIPVQHQPKNCFYS